MATDGFEIGIDFGTSNTVAMLRRPDGPVTPLLFGASPLLPSGVFAGPDAVLLTGADADQAATAEPFGFEPNPKRRIDHGTVWLGERELSVVDLIAAVLTRVGQEARRVAGRPPAGVVLTHPATWSHTRLGVLTDAAGRAGLGEVHLVAEPVAAAAYFTTVLGHDMRSGQCLVVYDLGAGTFDVSVVRRSLNGFEVLATDGLPDLGGLDLDATVVDHARGLTADATDVWGRLDWPQSAMDRRANHALWRDARAARERLSRHPTADLHLPLLDTNLHLTREEFDKVARAHLERSVELTLATLRTTGTAPQHLAGLFLVGGASRTPLAGTLLHRTLRIPATVIDQPELVVAQGSLHTQPTPASVTPTLPRARSAPPRPAVTAPQDATAAPSGRPPGPPPVVALAPAADSVHRDTGRDPADSRAPATVGLPSDGGAGPAGRKRRRGRLLLVGLGVLVTIGVVAAIVLQQRPDGNNANQSRSSAGPSVTARDPMTVLKGHAGDVYSVAFTAKGKALASGGADGTIRLWNPATGNPINKLVASQTHQVFSVAFNSAGTTLASAGDDHVIQLWNPATGESIGKPLAGHADTILSVAFSPTGGILASASADGTIRLWNLTTGRLLGSPLTGHGTYWVWSVAFSPDGGTLASAGADDVIRLWDPATGRPLSKSLVGHTDTVLSVAFSPKGEILASAGADGTVRLWNPTTGDPIGKPLAGHVGEVWTVAFSPDGKTLASAGADGTIRLWNPTTGESVGQPLRGHTGDVRSVAFLEDGTLASAGVDGSVRLWNVSGH